MINITIANIWHNSSSFTRWSSRHTWRPGLQLVNLFLHGFTPFKQSIIILPQIVVLGKVELFDVCKHRRTAFLRLFDILEASSLLVESYLGLEISNHCQ